MTSQEITAFARRAGNDREFAGKRVVIRRDDGMYFTGGCRDQWSSFRGNAVVLDYTQENVGGQIETVEMSYGVVWTCEEAS